jgi:hypothetical protein
MAVREKILDGLAWAGISEAARVAKISALLVREENGSYGRLTKTRIKEAVRDTSPPYGRGKIVCEKVEAETKRQGEIYKKRQSAQEEFQSWLRFRAKMGTRLNYAYAHTFERPPHVPYQSYPGEWSDHYDIRNKWDEEERDRDKGEECHAITHWQRHVVCLTTDVNGRHIISTRLNKGEIVQTFLRDDSEDLVQAAISLGGPKVRAAYPQGIRVTTDWVGRTSTVHYIDRAEVMLPWQAATYEVRQNKHGYDSIFQQPVLISGKSVVDDEDAMDEEV